MKTITYAELAKRLDAMKLFNKAPELDPDIYDGLESGNLYNDPEPCDWFMNDATVKAWCCNTHMFDGTGDYPATGKHPKQCDFAEDDVETKDIYQWYLIGSNDAEYLKRTTDELVFYSNVLDEYLWGVTHFGTPWDSVTLEIKE
jgi:hypothetical protein